MEKMTNIHNDDGACVLNSTAAIIVVVPGYSKVNKLENECYITIHLSLIS